MNVTARRRSRALILAVAAALSGLSLATIEQPAQAATCQPQHIKGTVNPPSMWSRLDGCDVHHLISQWALVRAGVARSLWPALNIPHNPEHIKTRTHGGFPGSAENRRGELRFLTDPANGATLCDRLLAAYDHFGALFLQDMAAIPSAFQADLVRALAEGRAALVAAIAAASPEDCNPTSALPARVPVVSGQADANPPSVAQGETTSVGAPNAGLTPGDEYDLVLADARRLGSGEAGWIVAIGPVIVDSTGGLPATTVRLGAQIDIRWESQGELDVALPGIGAAKLWFVRSHSGDVRTAAADVLITNPPGGGDRSEVIHSGNAWFCAGTAACAVGDRITGWNSGATVRWRVRASAANTTFTLSYKLGANKGPECHETPTGTLGQLTTDGAGNGLASISTAGFNPVTYTACASGSQTGPQHHNFDVF